MLKADRSLLSVSKPLSFHSVFACATQTGNQSGWMIRGRAEKRDSCKARLVVEGALVRRTELRTKLASQITTCDRDLSSFQKAQAGFRSRTFGLRKQKPGPPFSWVKNFRRYATEAPYGLVFRKEETSVKRRLPSGKNIRTEESPPNGRVSSVRKGLQYGRGLH